MIQIKKFCSNISAQINTAVKDKQTDQHSIQDDNLNSQITLHSMNSRLDEEIDIGKKLNLNNYNNNTYKQHLDVSKLLCKNRYCNSSKNNQRFLTLHVNIRSIQKNLNKLEELLLNTKLKPDLIALSETWHNSNSSYIPTLPNYEFISSDFSFNRAGGVAFFIKSDYNFITRSDIKISTHGCEDLWIEIKDQYKKSIIIGVLYFHPGNSVPDFQNSFENLILSLNKSKKPIFITGDFNIDSMNAKHDTFFKSISTLGLGFQQLVSSPTHYSHINSSFSLIDHFYSNKIMNDIQIKILIHDISDHFPILININKSVSKQPQYKYYTKRDMKHFKSDEFVDDVRLKLGNMAIQGDPNQAFNHFKNTFYKILDTHAPFKKFSRREIKLQQKPWINYKMMRLIKKKK